MRDDGTDEYLTLVSLGINPPHVCNGSGPTEDEARNQGAFAALVALAETKSLCPQEKTANAGACASDSTVTEEFLPVHKLENEQKM